MSLLHLDYKFTRLQSWMPTQQSANHTNSGEIWDSCGDESSWEQYKDSEDWGGQ